MQRGPGKQFLHWPSTRFAQISGRQAGKHTLCKTSALWINFLLNFGLINNHTWYKKYISEAFKLKYYRGAVTINGTWHYYDDYRRTIKARDLKKCAANVPSTHTGFLLSHCVYIASDLGRKLFYVSFKNATIDVIIINVNTLFLYNITRMPYFVASDELTLATFMFEPETLLPWLDVGNAVYL